MNKIAELLHRKRTEIARRKELPTPVVPDDDRRVFWKTNEFRIFAEIKRASLSAGAIRPDLDLHELARSYEAAGASAISVLTEEYFFHGTMNDLRAVRSAVHVPILQKDFILDEFQIAEAKEAGADFVLLIARFLASEQIERMVKVCDGIGMNAIVEVTDEEDIGKLRFPVRFVGVNSRDLETLNIDLSKFERLRDKLPDAFLIAESGIRNTDTLKQISALGYHAALIGEHLLRSYDPAAELKSFLQQSTAGVSPAAISALRPVELPERTRYTPKVKICGITNEQDAQIAIEAGASALGFIFAESPRAISVEKLKTFRDRIRALCVGVFRGKPAEEIRRITEECSLDVAQIYEKDIYARIPVWRARTVTSITELDECNGRNVLVDLKLPESKLQEAWGALQSKRVFVLAGSLDPLNVTQAISACQPEWVDVARGVEREPGKKDPAKVHSFMRAVQI